MNESEQLAAEYVLGTLDFRTRQQVNERRRNEPELEKLIEDWEVRLSPLLEEVAEQDPTELLWRRIKQALDAPGPAQTVQPARFTDELSQLRRQLSRWKAAAVGGFGIAAGLLIALLTGLPLSPLPSDDRQYVAVFQKNDEQPAFIMTVDLASRQLRIEPVTAEGVPGKTYQLWIKSDLLGPDVRSLGLLDSPEGPTHKRLVDYDADLLRSATFGISLEPEGGSQTGQPTGPAIHGTLYDTSI